MTRGTVSLSCATTPHHFCFSKSCRYIKSVPLSNLNYQGKKWLFWEKEPEVKNRNSFLTEIRISGCKLGFDIEPVLRLKTSLWNFSTVGIYVDPVLFIVLVTFNVVYKLFIINILKLMPNAYCSYFSITPAYKEYSSIPHRPPLFNTSIPHKDHTQTPSIQHQKSVSSTQKSLSSTLKTPQFNTPIRQK